MFTLDIIASSSAPDRLRISEAYADAQALAASIERDKGSCRPRIVACLERYTACKAAEDVAAVAWILVAIQERISEHDLPGWPTLKIVADKAAALVRVPKSQVH